MKKTIAFIFAAALILSLFSGCNKAKIQALEITESEFNAAIKVIEITDNYLDFKITKDEAKSQIEDVESRIIEGDSIHSIGIGADISYISFALTSPHNKSDDILKKRNDLAESIGEGIRNK